MAIYVNDIFIYSTSPKENLEHIRKVLETLDTIGCLLTLKKYSFFTDSLVFLGYIISTEGIDPAKVKAIQNWPTTSTISEIQGFHELASFYLRFIWNFSNLSAWLHSSLIA